MKCIGVTWKLLVFFFVPLVMQKAQKVESIYYIQSDCKTTSKKSTDPSRVLHAVEKYEKVESVNTQNDWETTSINWTDKKKTNLFCVFCKCLNSKKTSSRSFKLFLGNNNNNNKKTSWKSHQSQWSLHNKYGWSKAEDWQ